jgi:hypothetical protein
MMRDIRERSYEKKKIKETRRQAGRKGENGNGNGMEMQSVHEK